MQVLVLLAFLLPAVFATGQKPYFRSIKLPDEIQQTSITCLYQDTDSYMWIGTGKGLYQFDGNDFIYYTLSDRNAFLQVTALYMAPDKVLWVGTRKGEIYLLKNDSLELFNPEEGNPKVAVTSFAADNSGNLWLSTYGEGVYCYNGKHIYNINTDDGLTDNYCYMVTPDESGRIWAATDGGISVCSFRNGRKRVQKITSSEGLPDNIVLCLTAGSGYIWAGMQDAGICSIDIKTLKIHVPEASGKWSSGPVNNIVTGKSWLWIATEKNGIFSISSTTGNLIGNYESDENTSFARINKMYADKQGNYWIASGSELLLSLGNDLLNFNDFASTTGKNIHSVLADRKGNIWFSNDEGLFYHNNDKGHTTKLNLPLKVPTQIISLYEDISGYIWAGTFGSGLFCIDPQSRRVKLFGEADGLTNGNILSIAGKGNQMWLATLGGAYKCQISADPLAAGAQVSFISFEEQHFPGNNYIYAVFIDSRNRIWFGTDGKGISVLDNGRFSIFDKTSGLKSNIIYSITEDSDGNIWFSTSNAGIYRYDGKSFRNYTTGDGLSDTHITGLLADKKHHLLIIHNNGVDMLDTRSDALLYYSTGVGMSEINPDQNVSILQGSDVAWLGTQNGLIRLQIPDDISKRQPSLQLGKISLLLGKENYIGTYIFPYNKNHISFHFNALWFIAPSLIKYQIRLKGYDLDWIDTRNNMVTYSNLSPGNYTFEVRASMKGNYSHSEVKSYSFTIKKPFWKTTWFIIASVLGMALTLYLIISLREKALKRRDASEREKIMFQFQTLRSQVNPHFLFNSFSTLITIIDEDKEVAIEYVEKLSQFFREILDYRDKELITLREELKLIDTYYFLQKKRYCENLQLNNEVDEKELESLIPPMVLQMLVENAIKHNVVSAEKPFSVRIFTEGNHIFVTNILQPKKISVPSTGIGLANIRNRYTLLGYGETSVENTGNEFIVKLPLIYH